MLGSLPLELVANIIRQTEDPFSAFRYQCVCRKWRSVLSAPVVLDASLGLWYSPKDPPPLGQHNDTHYRKLERMARFLRSEPSCTRYYNHDNLQGTRYSRYKQRYTYAHGRVAGFHDAECRSVFVRDLTSGDTKIYHGEARERVGYVALSDELCAFAVGTG